MPHGVAVEIESYNEEDTITRIGAVIYCATARRCLSPGPRIFIRLWIRGLRTEWERKSRNRKQESGDVQGIHRKIDRELKGRALDGGRY